MIALDATRDNKIVQDLEDGGYVVDPVRFSSANKRTLIENLITELEAGRITIPEAATTLINELEVYESHTSDRGRVQYTAPAGFHDDCVDALALAVAAGDPTPRKFPPRLSHARLVAAQLWDSITKPLRDRAVTGGTARDGVAC